MPIIDFPFVVDGVELHATISSAGTLSAGETVNGITPSAGELLPVYVRGVGRLIGNVTVDGISYIGAAISGAGSVSATAVLSKNLRATILGIGQLDAFYEYGGGIVFLPGVASFGSETHLLSAKTALNKLYAEGYSSSYIPPRTTVGFGLLLGITGAALSVEPWTGRGFLNPLVSKGWLTDAAVPPTPNSTADGFGYLPWFIAYSAEGKRLEPLLFSSLDAFSWHEPLGQYFAQFNSSLTGLSSFVALELAIDAFTSSLSLASSFTRAGVFTELLTNTGSFTTEFFGTPLFSSAVISELKASASFSSATILFAELLSSMTLGDLYALYVQAASEFLSTLVGTDTYTNIADFSANLNSTLSLASVLVGASKTGNPLANRSRTWAINLSNSASAQYDNYGFQSLARYKDNYYGLTEEGLYRLEGATDDGFPIEAILEFALSRFATPQKKYFPSVYLGVTTAGKMLLKVVLDGVDWFYEANNTAANTANQRIDLGRGLAGSHWRFILLNQNGDDFALESVEFMPLISSRRVY